MSALKYSSTPLPLGGGRVRDGGQKNIFKKIHK